MISTLATSLYDSAKALASKHFKAEEAEVLAARIKLAADHLSFTETKLEASEKDIAKLEVQNETLAQELAKVKEELAKLDGFARLIDIGPCSIKKDKENIELNGVYCNDCKGVLTFSPAEWVSTSYLDSAKGCSVHATYFCSKCKAVFDDDMIKKALSNYHKKHSTTP